MQDVSGDSRRFLQRKKYTSWRERWLNNHPYLAEYPDEIPNYLREKAAQRGEVVKVERDFGLDEGMAWGQAAQAER